jgi:serine/threonine protein kinase
LDLLSSGACNEDTFLRGVGELLKRAPDVGWELLALVDQYYRRGKISADVFIKVKAHLQDLMMGKGRAGDISVPLPRPMSATPPASLGSAPTAAVPATDAAIALTIALPPSLTSIRPPPTAGAAPKPVSAPTPRGAAPTVVRETAAAASRPDAERSLAVGDVLRGRYRIQALLGQGGMGTVFEATDLYRLDRTHGDQKVALKVLHTAVIQRPRLFAELRREFQHLQSLSHPNIVRVHEFDRDGDLAFFTMEYLSGLLLTRVLSVHVSSPLEPAYAWAIVRDVGAAVTHAHARGVVHGDLNPGNIFITDGGDVRVLDFGAAHTLRRTPWISDFETSQQINVATPSYASCQLLEGETADARDDIYALACITYVLLTGNLPFREHSALKARTLGLKPERPDGLTRGQWQALRTGLDFDRDRRPTDMQAWLDQLRCRSAAATHLPALPNLLTPRPTRTRSLGWSAVFATVGALVVAWVWWATSHPDDVAHIKAMVGERLRATFANTMVSQLWDGQQDAHEDLTASPPPGGDPTASAAAPEPTIPHAAAPPAKASISPPRAAAATSPASAPGIGAGTAAAASGIHARLELAADNVELQPGDSVAHVAIRRSRTLRGDVSFRWWTESGTAKPGRDFTPVMSHVEQAPEGRSTVDLMIPIIANPGRHDPRSFYVVIDEPSENAALGQRTLTMVTIP